jgi:hypothetical protein
MPPSPFLDPAITLTAADGTPVAASSLWADGRPVVLYLLRRPGCLLCRATAKKLWEAADAVTAAAGGGADRLVCVAHEWLPAEIAAFRDGFWRGPIFKDQAKALFAALGDGKVRRASALSLLNPLSRMWAHGREAKKVVADSNFVGDGLTLGGVMVVKGGAVVWAFKEEQFGDAPEPQAVVDAVKAATAAAAARGTE